MSSVSAEEVRAYVLEQLAEPLGERGLSAADVGDDFDLLTSGLIDSLGVLELIVGINERFGLDIDYEELDPDGLTVVGPFTKYVAQVTAGSADP